MIISAALFCKNSFRAEENQNQLSGEVTKMSAHVLKSKSMQFLKSQSTMLTQSSKDGFQSANSGIIDSGMTYSALNDSCSKIVGLKKSRSKSRSKGLL